MYYRGSGPWGPGKGSNLTAAEFDSNTYQVQQQIAAKAAQGVGIAAFNIVGDELYVTLTDHSILGPYPLPVANISFVGAWQPNTQYYTNQIFTVPGADYIVLVNHVSASTFDPGANDGAGHNYYGLLLSNPANALPSGGAPGQVLEKNTTADFAVSWAWQTLAGLHDVLASPAPTTGELVYWNGSAFSYIAPASLTTAPGSLRGLSDVLPSPGPTTDQVVYWNGSKFTFGSLPVLYPVPTPALASLSDVSQAPIASANQLVYFDGYLFNFETPTTSILEDVGISSPQQGDGLFYDSASSKWLNAPSGLKYSAWSGGSRTAALSDINTVIDNSGGGTLTIPVSTTVAFPVGATFWVRQSQQYQVTIVGGSGVTLVPPLGKSAVTARPGALIAIQQQNSLNNWNLSGDLIDLTAGTNLLPTSGTWNLDNKLTATETFYTTPTGNNTINCVIGPPSGAPVGRRMTFVITTSGTTSYTYTFGSNFKSQGPLATGTVSGKVFVIEFIGDGTFFNEVSRTTAM